MSNYVTTSQYHHCFKVGSGVVLRYFLSINLPVEINGRLNDNFTMKLHITSGKKLRLCTHISLSEGTSNQEINPLDVSLQAKTQSQGEEDNKPFIFLYASLLEKLLKGEEFENDYPSTEFSTGIRVFFSKQDDGYYLEQIPIEHLTEPLTSLRQRFLRGDSLKRYKIFFFTEETHNKLVEIFKMETELRTQLGW